MKTNKTYLVRKDITKPFGPDNWYIFQESEYCRFKKTAEFNQCKRYFTQVDACAGGGDIIVAECDHEKWLRMERERAEERYRRSQKKKSGIKIVSLEALMDDPNADDIIQDGAPLIIDPSADVESIVIEKERDKAIHAEVNNLPTDSKAIIHTMFFSGKPCSEVTCSKRLGVHSSTIHRHKTAAFNYLSKALKDWRYD